MTDKQTDRGIIGKMDETLYNTYVRAQGKNPDRVALYSREDETVTHGRLLDEIDRAAAGLRALYPMEGMKIGVISSCSYEEVVFLLAGSKIGAVTKFIDFTKNITEINESIVESALSILVMGPEFVPMEPFINPGGMPVIIMGELPEMRQHYCSYGNLLDAGDGRSVTATEYRDNACTVIINSSGTTGTPKPIELSDRAVNAAVEKFICTDFPLTPSNVMLKIIPSFLGMGIVSTAYLCLITGTPIIYVMQGNEFQAIIDEAVRRIFTFAEFAKEKGISYSAKLLIFASPMFFRGMYQQLDQVESLSYIGCMLAGGSAMSREELERIDAAFADKGCTVPVLSGYGQNEMAGGVTMNEIANNRRGSVGKAMAKTELLVVDMKTGMPVPHGTAGKILERSESLFVGYENMPEKTAESFVRIGEGEPWFDTNDVGYMDEDGYLYITGRTSRIIIRQDMKVSLDKVENKLRASTFIKEVGVIAKKDGDTESVVAFVTIKDEYTAADISSEQIIGEIQKSKNPLNDREVVDKLLIVDSLPYRSSGKIDYKSLEKSV